MRQGRYDHGPEQNGQWFAEAAEVERALEQFGPRGKVLEIACGTGLWTRHLVRYADAITALDASPEMIAINRARLGDERVRYVLTDIYAWQPDERYDAVFFGFWLSHVPPARFRAFWELVRACLAPGGRVFLVDSLYSESSVARDHGLEGREATAALRRLNDGREFRVVKVFYEPAELAARLGTLDWQAEVRGTANYFPYGWAAPAAGARPCRPPASGTSG